MKAHSNHISCPKTVISAAIVCQQHSCLRAHAPIHKVNILIFWEGYTDYKKAYKNNHQKLQLTTFGDYIYKPYYNQYDSS